MAYETSEIPDLPPATIYYVEANIQLQYLRAY